MQMYRLNDLQAKIREKGLLIPLDVLLVGGTGVGKSSTLNALFGSTVAKVGEGVDPETQHISAYKMHDYLRIHDSAGLGDGKASDIEHSKNILNSLYQTCQVNSQDYGFMDLAMVLLDGSSRDLGTTFKLLESVVLSAIHPERVIVAINQADMAMKGRNWNEVKNKPEQALIDFLEEKSIATQKRIQESTGLTIRKPVYYSAKHHYNIDAFIDHIIGHLPSKRRVMPDWVDAIS